ncbi:MAG TPA: DUF882 domain-containing protein [Pseudolabrys sp.]|nr:DUF882 domain-containing protein [Pseudolabrys sp.]
MSVGRAYEHRVVVSLARLTVRLGISALFLIAGMSSLQTAIAEGDTRTLSFHHVHTGEDITVTFKRNGRYDEAALKKLDWFMRDWRKEKSTHMDPHLFDLLWQVYREVGASRPIQVICGYRSPETNSMLRRRSTGVAQFSQHTHGQAMDFFIPGVPLSEIRAVGLKLQRGGVGFYPTSGSPFVHLDTGSVRYWPHMSREQLVKIFPHGRTVHIPSDGRPLPGYALALADVERHGSKPSSVSLSAARNAGAISSTDIRVAEQPRPKRNLLARLFGLGDDNDEDNDARSEPAASKHSRTPRTVASLSRPARVVTERIVPLPAARPAGVQVASAANPAQSAARNVFDNYSFWNANADARPISQLKNPIDIADAGPTTTGSTDISAFAYAGNDGSFPAPRAHPMGTSIPRMQNASLMPSDAPNTTVIDKQALMPGRAMHAASGLEDDPWLRATVLTLSANYMTSTQLGAAHMKMMSAFMRKPDQALAMTFSADPQPGLLADRFSGHAVVFLATRTFSNRTASLR